METKKVVIIAAAVFLLLGLAAGMAGIYWMTRPEPQDPAGEAEKAFTLTVVHSDGTTRVFTLKTDEVYLGDALVAEGVIVVSDSAGKYDTVDGETASWSENQSYWAFYVGEAYATQGMDTTPVNDGDVFKLVYTVG